ncbi:MAG: oligosaccharide flippase family protein, partial [Candidatus Absconditabacterales bacterium]
MSDHIDHHISQKGILKNTFWIYAAALITAPMQYIIRIIVAQNLPLEQVGLYYSLLSLTGILAVYNDLGFKEAIGYFYPKYLAEKDYNKSKTLLWFTLAFQLITSCILAGLLYYFAQRIALNYLNDPTSAFIVQIFGVYLVCYIIYNFVDGLFLVFQDGFWNKMLSLINYILLITTIALVPYGLFSFLGVRSNLTGFVLAQIVPAVLTI